MTQAGTIRTGDAVFYRGSDEDDVWLWNGHPGRLLELVDDGTTPPTRCVVIFVGGPSLEMQLSDVAPAAPVEFLYRVGLLRLGLHPITERPIGPSRVAISDEEAAGS